jgi:hypothetical protein
MCEKSTSFASLQLNTLDAGSLPSVVQWPGSNEPCDIFLYACAASGLSRADKTQFDSATFALSYFIGCDTSSPDVAVSDARVYLGTLQETSVHVQLRMANATSPSEANQRHYRQHAWTVDVTVRKNDPKKVVIPTSLTCSSPNDTNISSDGVFQRLFIGETSSFCHNFNERAVQTHVLVNSRRRILTGLFENIVDGEHFRVVGCANRLCEIFHMAFPVTLVHKPGLENSAFERYIEWTL